QPNSVEVEKLATHRTKIGGECSHTHHLALEKSAGLLLRRSLTTSLHAGLHISLILLENLFLVVRENRFDLLGLLAHRLAHLGSARVLVHALVLKQGLAGLGILFRDGVDAGPRNLQRLGTEAQERW